MEAEIIEGEAVEVTNALVVRDETRSAALWEVGQLTDEEFDGRMAMLRSGVERVKQLQRSLLVEGEDWGTIPGVKNPLLYKSGAERLAAFYRLVPEFHLTVDTQPVEMVTGETGAVTLDRITYTARCLLHFESQDGPVVGDGSGVCSSFEKRYLWRKAEVRCPQCGKATVIKGKAEYGGGWLCWNKKGGCGTKFGANDQRITTQGTGDVLNLEPHDMANTLAKMAEKRAHVDAVIRTLGVSNLFTQDEDSSQVRPGGGEDDWGSFTDAPVAASEAPGREKPPAERKSRTRKEEKPPAEPEPDSNPAEWDDPEVDHRATGERNAPVSFEGEVVRVTWDATPQGNPYVRAVVKGGDAYYHCLMPRDTASQVGITGEPVKGEKVIGVTDGAHVMVTGKWQHHPEGNVVIVDGWVM